MSMKQGLLKVGVSAGPLPTRAQHSPKYPRPCWHSLKEGCLRRQAINLTPPKRVKAWGEKNPWQDTPGQIRAAAHTANWSVSHQGFCRLNGSRPSQSGPCRPLLVNKILDWVNNALVSLLKDISTFVDYVHKAIFVEEKEWYYLIHRWRDKRVHAFPKGISLKVNAIAWLEFKLTNYT